jgi:dihydroorotase
MPPTYDLVIRNATLVNHDGIGPGDVGVRAGRIAAIGDLGQAQAGEVIDATGLHILPGVIDTQVHFREPGMEHKEDLESGSRAAVLGGVTAVFEMPNTKPPTTNPDAIAEKVRRGTHRMFCDFTFYAGGTAENAEILPELEHLPGVCGVKVFIGSSTGNLLVPDDKGIAKILSNITRRAAFHSEDEYLLREHRASAELGRVETHPVWRSVEVAVSSTTRLLDLARKAGKQIHVLHISTAEELEILAAHKDIATVEVTPQHLTLAAPDCYERLGTLAQMNPPIRDARHRDGLWAGLRAGIVDIIGSDHAPHTLEEKAEPYPKSPSGMPGVQTLLPLMLNHVAEGRLTLPRLVDLVCHGPQRVFGIAGKGRMAVGYDADLTLVDLNATREITEDWISGKVGWSPFVGQQVKGWPMMTVIRGRAVMRDGEITTPAMGFWSNL